jgi:hypothetical protein
MATARRAGLQGRLNEAITGIVGEYTRAATGKFKRQLKTNYMEEFYRQAWMLDVLTPPNVTPKIKPHSHYREADIPIYSGRNAATAWFNRFGAWTDAWGKVLGTNLALNAMHGGGINDFAQEVDATKVGSPAFTAWDIFKNIFITEILTTQSEARFDFSDDNKDLALEEIWQTMEDERVCDICGPLDGKPMSEVDEYQPAHPRCRCFTRVVPKAWADLADRDLARAIDNRGLVPDAMIVRDKNGIISGAAIVSFEKWQENQARLITTGI